MDVLLIPSSGVKLSPHEVAGMEFLYLTSFTTGATGANPVYGVPEPNPSGEYPVQLLYELPTGGLCGLFGEFKHDSPDTPET